MVGFKESVPDQLRVGPELGKSYGFVVEHVYGSGGFFAREISPEALGALRRDSRVLYIEHNESITLTANRPNNRLESALARPTRKSDALSLAAQPERSAS